MTEAVKSLFSGILYFACCCCCPCCNSCRKLFFPTFVKQPEGVDFTFSLLALKPNEIKKLKNAFRKADDDGSGELSPGEFTEFIGVEHTKFSERVFGVMDLDLSGVMDFEEFVVACWNYATLNEEGLRRFAFTLYDDDDSASLSTREIKDMFSEICGDDFAKSERAAVLYQRIEDMAKYNSTDGEVTPIIFSEFVKRNPAILKDAFHMQVMIRQSIVSEKFWDRLADRRFDLYADQKDGGWLHIRRELKKKAIERSKNSGEDLEVQPKAKGLSREKMRMMAARETFLKKKAGKKRPTIVPKPGVESDYTKRFKAWKFDAMGIHEEYEYYMEKKASVAPIPDNYMDSNVLTCPTRESSLYVENARIRDEVARIRTMHRDIQRFAKQYTFESQGKEEGDTRLVHMDDPGHERGVAYRENESKAPGVSSLDMFDGK